MIAEHQRLLDQLTAGLQRDPRIQAAWLYGSLAREEGDAWSDVDIVAQVDPDDLKGCLADYRSDPPGMPQTVLAREVYGCTVVAVTPAWERFDIMFLTREQMGRMDGKSLRPLLGDAAMPPPKPPVVDTGAPARLDALVHEFLRVLGLAPVVVGREEWLVAQQGVDLLRKMTADVMLEANAVPQAARGAKRLNAYLLPAQRQALEALDPPPARREPLIAAHAAIGRLFLSQAKPVAQRLGVAWPQGLEDATRRHLKAALDVEV